MIFITFFSHCRRVITRFYAKNRVIFELRSKTFAEHFKHERRSVDEIPKRIWLSFSRLGIPMHVIIVKSVSRQVPLKQLWDFGLAKKRRGPRKYRMPDETHERSHPVYDPRSLGDRRNTAFEIFPPSPCVQAGKIVPPPRRIMR